MIMTPFKFGEFFKLVFQPLAIALQGQKNTFVDSTSYSFTTIAFKAVLLRVWEK
jgi:hypothetical protein